jgi:hypothetical protein
MLKELRENPFRDIYTDEMEAKVAGLKQIAEDVRVAHERRLKKTGGMAVEVKRPFGWTAFGDPATRH